GGAADRGQHQWPRSEHLGTATPGVRTGRARHGSGASLEVQAGNVERQAGRGDGVRGGEFSAVIKLAQRQHRVAAGHNWAPVARFGEREASFFRNSRLRSRRASLPFRSRWKRALSPLRADIVVPKNSRVGRAAYGGPCRTPFRIGPRNFMKKWGAPAEWGGQFWPQPASGAAQPARRHPAPRQTTRTDRPTSGRESS